MNRQIKKQMTAEEFFRNKIKEKNPNIEVVTLSRELITAEEGMRWAYEFKQLHLHAVMCCASCFKEIPENHFERRAYHDNEHCPNCGNDFMGSKWFSQPLPKNTIDKIRAVLLA